MVFNVGFPNFSLYVIRSECRDGDGELYCVINLRNSFVEMSLSIILFLFVWVARHCVGLKIKFRFCYSIIKLIDYIANTVSNKFRNKPIIQCSIEPKPSNTCACYKTGKENIKVYNRTCLILLTENKLIFRHFKFIKKWKPLENQQNAYLMPADSEKKHMILDKRTDWRNEERTILLGFANRYLIDYSYTKPQ